MVIWKSPSDYRKEQNHSKRKLQLYWWRHASCSQWCPVWHMSEHSKRPIQRAYEIRWRSGNQINDSGRSRSEEKVNRCICFFSAPALRSVGRRQLHQINVQTNCANTKTSSQSQNLSKVQLISSTDQLLVHMANTSDQILQTILEVVAEPCQKLIHG